MHRPDRVSTLSAFSFLFPVVVSAHTRTQLFSGVLHKTTTTIQDPVHSLYAGEAWWLSSGVSAPIFYHLVKYLQEKFFRLLDGHSELFCLLMIPQQPVHSWQTVSFQVFRPETGRWPQEESSGSQLQTSVGFTGFPPQTCSWHIPDQSLQHASDSYWGIQ